MFTTGVALCMQMNAQGQHCVTQEDPAVMTQFCHQKRHIFIDFFEVTNVCT